MVRVYPCLRERFDSLQLDAKRIMGLEPCRLISVGEKVGTWPTEMRELPMNHSQRNRGRKYGEYLLPPEKESDTWHYAQQLLNLKWPVVSLWGDRPGYKVVNLSDLEEISK